MSITVENWDSVSFPVFRVPALNPIQEDGTVLYSYKEYRDAETGELIPAIRILDDKSLPGDTLGKRRLQLRQLKVRVLQLHRAVYFLSDLIKLTNGTTTFVDSNGKLFTYTKTRTVPLVFRKISKKFPILNGIGTILEVEGLPHRFKTSCYLKGTDTFAGLLKIGSGYILYGIYDQQYDATVRKV